MFACYKVENYTSIQQDITLISQLDNLYPNILNREYSLKMLIQLTTFNF